MVNKLHQFVLNYSGPKVTIVASGGGSHLSLLTSIPGSSKIINGVYHPYNVDTVHKFISNTTIPDSILLEENSEGYFKAVQMGMAALLAKSVYEKDGVGIGITAGLTTNRYRKGANEAYICKFDPMLGYTIWHAVFDKISEDQYKRLGKTAIEVVSLSKRQEEDIKLSEIVLDILLGREIVHEPFRCVYKTT